MRVRWLGTAGFAIEHGGHVLLLDPYVTRASLAACVTGALRPDVEAIARHVPRADAIVRRAHPLRPRARRAGDRAPDGGSRVRLAIGGGALPGERRSGRPHRGRREARRALRWSARSVPSPCASCRARTRSSCSAGCRLSGDIADCDDVPLRVNGYRCGAVFGVEIRVAGRTLYHVGSAELVDANIPVEARRSPAHVRRRLDVDARFPRARGAPLAPGAVLLSHWDNFLRPIHRPARVLPAMQLPRLVERLSTAARGVNIGTLPLLGEVWA